ncbi:MAG: hypothetical protein MZV64_04175 [Ignavibacteriales bacterium]|nr:hypothetical protein [Ignavibacteriales bacterium]
MTDLADDQFLRGAAEEHETHRRCGCRPESLPDNHTWFDYHDRNYAYLKKYIAYLAEHDFEVGISLMATVSAMPTAFQRITGLPSRLSSGTRIM